MFGSQKNSSGDIPEPTLHIQTIPAEFYGGNNPVVQFKNVKREIVRGSFDSTLEATTSLSKGPLAPATSATSASVKRILSNRKYLLLGALALFILFGVITAGYYWYQLKSQTVQTVALSPISAAPVLSIPEQSITSTASVAVPVTNPATESVVIPEPPTTTVAAEPTLEFPSALLTNSVDLDKDGLTDAEEELFKTDPANPDTDADKYNDSQEIYNLYDPTHPDSAKLIDSDLVKDYVNPVFGYSVYYPASWAFGSIDQNNRDVLFSTITGENIEIRVFDKQGDQTFLDWFNQTAGGESFSELTNFSSAFNEAGQSRKDGLVYYFEDAVHRFVLVYHTLDSNTVNYPNVIKMMARSFRLAGNNSSIPARVVEEGDLSQLASSTAATATSP